MMALIKAIVRRIQCWNSRIETSLIVDFSWNRCLLRELRSEWIFRERVLMTIEPFFFYFSFFYSFSNIFFWIWNGFNALCAYCWMQSMCVSTNTPTWNSIHITQIKQLFLLKMAFHSRASAATWILIGFLSPFAVSCIRIVPHRIWTYCCLSTIGHPSPKVTFRTAKNTKNSSKISSKLANN